MERQIITVFKIVNYRGRRTGETTLEASKILLNTFCEWKVNKTDDSKYVSPWPSKAIEKGRIEVQVTIQINLI